MRGRVLRWRPARTGERRARQMSMVMAGTPFRKRPRPMRGEYPHHQFPGIIAKADVVGCLDGGSSAYPLRPLTRPLSGSLMCRIRERGAAVDVEVDKRAECGTICTHGGQNSSDLHRSEVGEFGRRVDGGHRRVPDTVAR